jgi:2-aminobenzoate-CoA ligase
MFPSRYPRMIMLNDSTEVRLRPLQEGDTEALTHLFRDSHDEDVRVMRDNVTNPDVLRSWTERIDPERVLPIVAELDEQIIGLVSLHRHPGTPHANIGQMRLYVRPDYRQRGLGSLLLDEVIELARDLGLEQLVIELVIDNVSMISAFQRRGFEREATLPVYQMVIMRYNLITRPGREALDMTHAAELPPRRDWPDLLFDQEIFEIPTEFNLCELLLDERLAAGWGARPAIYYQDEVVTYELLLGEVQRLASGLAHLGIRAGDAVLLHLPNSAQAIAANLAVQRLGGLSVPTSPQLSSHELAFIIQDCQAVAAITTDDLAHEVLAVRGSTGGTVTPVIVQGRREHKPEEQIYSYARLVARSSADRPPVRRRRDEIALLLYTSADSGHPRGTAHRLDGILAVLDTFGGNVWRINEEDVVGSLAPLGSTQGFITWGLLPFRYGASVALPDDPLAQTGDALAAAIQRHRITLLSASPITYREILANPMIDVYYLASLRLCSSGGEPLTGETYDAWNDRFEQPIFESFSTTEMLYTFLSNAVDMVPRAGSLGRVVPGYQVKVVGDQGNDLKSGEIGYLMARGPTGTLYWNDPDSQRRSVRNGWNRLSDYGLVDEDGYYWFVSRSDDLIKTRGYRIDPSEVETALCEHPHVKESAVIGLHDEMRGQRPVAFVIPGEREEPSNVLAFSILESLPGRLADYKIPDEIIFVQELPRNPEGQLLRRVLRDQVRRQYED